MSVLSNKIILVTGGTGTFGQAFVKFALKHNVSKVIVYSRDELKQAQMEFELGKSDRLRFYLGDVRDCDRLEMAMRGVDYVIHAAALKRVEKCELDPLEAVKTNIDGSANVIKASLRADVKRVVATSTDKSNQPTTLYGATKLAMERLIIAANNISGGKCHFSVVQFGNLWGSRGSVIPQWRDLSRANGTVPLTHPDATRFFMTTDDVLELVMEALIGDDYFYAPKQLKSYRIADLAVAMGVKTEIIGLPPYEKLHEQFDNFSSDMGPFMSVDELRQEL